MNREILFKAKHVHALSGNKHLDGEWVEGYLCDENYINTGESERLIDPATICQYTGLTDKNGKKIWENDILMCHGNPMDLVKATFGKFSVIDADTESEVDDVIGWHYEVIPTDALSRCEPFCYSMPLTEDYIELCEMEVIGNIFDNPELLEEKAK